MTKATANLCVFLATVIAGVSCLALGHEAIGAGLLAAAIGHGIPSPFAKQPETVSTPGIERVEGEQE